MASDGNMDASAMTIVDLQDFFDAELIPADSDYRMFSSKHYGWLPGIDVASVLDATAYHTHQDNIDRIRPGTIQVTFKPCS